MLKKILSLFLMTLILFGLIFTDAEARRFGGGRSFGTYRSPSSFSRVNPVNNLRQTAAPQTNRWLGPLAGLVAGGVLASLFMGHGFGTGILMWLAIGAIVLLVVRVIKNMLQPAAVRRPASSHLHNMQSNMGSYFSSGASNPNPTTINHPLGFDTDNFLREAKVQFYRLQAAYDKANLNDIREFTTPEVTAEIQMQLKERGNAANQTDVINLDAELLAVQEEPSELSGATLQQMFATVQFSGLIQEERNSPAAAFNEVWHFKKEAGSARWLVAGIQQN